MFIQLGIDCDRLAPYEFKAYIKHNILNERTKGVFWSQGTLIIIGHYCTA